METIEVSNLGFAFNAKEDIINDISFSVKKGDVFAILGASGSGKSTILRLLSDILGNKEGNKLEGQVSIFGSTPEEYRESGELAFMFQSANLMPNLTVRQNIEFPLVLRQESIKTSEIDNLLETVGLKRYENYYPKELSGGMKTRVALARSFVTKPDLLLLDEPFSALDISWRFELYSYLEKVKTKYGTTVILVSHDIQEAILLANDIFVLSTKGSKITEVSISQKDRTKVFDYEHANSFLEKNQSVFFSVQSHILVDGTRNKTTIEDVRKLCLEINEHIEKNSENNPSVNNRLNAIKDFVEVDEVKNYIINFWETSDGINFKFELSWKLLDISDINDIYHQQVFDFFNNNTEEIIDIINSQNYFQLDTIFNDIESRINSSEYVKKKNWMYLMYLKLKTKNTPYEKEAKEYIENLIYPNVDERLNLTPKSILNEII